MAQTIPASSPLRSFGLVLLTAVVYFGLARVSLLLAFQDSNATPVWPPSGWALAAVLLLGWRVAPGVLLGAWAANVAVFLAHGIGIATSLWTSALIGVGNTAEALAGWFLLRLLLPGVPTPQYFQKVVHVLRFLLAVVLMCLISCTTGLLVIYGAGIAPPGLFFTIWFTWWIGDVSGVLLFTPLLLAWASGGRPRVSTSRLAEGALLFGGLILASGTVFNNWFHPPVLFTRAFWVTPFLIWAAVRFGQRVVVTAVLSTALLALYGTVQGMSIFSAPTLNDALLATQAFLAVNGVMALLLHAALAERGQVTASLLQSHRDLERLVAERTAVLDHQRVEIEHLLLNILPSEVAKELQTTGKATPRSYEQVSVLFSDFKDFSLLAEKMSAREVVEVLNTCFREFDRIIEKYRLEKIKTIGDAYMCAGGIHATGPDHPLRIIGAGIEIRDFMRVHNEARKAAGQEPMEVRIGVHVGPVVAGVVGTRKYAYDIWGSTVNIASRMESSGAPGEVNISAATYELVKEKYACRYRGKIYAKNVGEIDMYFVEHEIPPPETSRSQAALQGAKGVAAAGESLLVMMATTGASGIII